MCKWMKSLPYEIQSSWSIATIKKKANSICKCTISYIFIHFYFVFFVYMAINSNRFEEMVKLSLDLLMNMEGLLPVCLKNLFLQHPNRPKTQNILIPI